MDKSTLTHITRRTTLAGLTALGANAFLPRRASAQGTMPLILGIIGPTVEYYPIFVAQKKGYFEAEDVALDLVTTGSSANSAQMVAADAINIGSSSWLDTVRGVAGGAPLVIVASSLVNATTMMLGAKDITSVEQLKGKRVSVGGAKDITMVWWSALAEQNGLHPTEDVEVIFGGGTSARFGALAGGAVQAAAVATPLAFTAIQEGYNNLGVLGPLLPNVPYMTWHANRAWAEANPETVKAFIRAHSKAIDFLYDPANREEAIDILVESTQASADEAALTHDLVVEIQGFKEGSEFAMADVEGVIALLADWGDVDATLAADTIGDTSYLAQ
ncbi:ABC transporter substrate-binding protein [Microbaculum marinum]|uniref:ABC transporter substrate-binding protein n=1 Tax=Microbaculum marinum TaxID=1764581 RepID=A0AAW9REQ1_9HYPH